jgi:hypothetical protein
MHKFTALKINTCTNVKSYYIEQIKIKKTCLNNVFSLENTSKIEKK